MMPASGDGLCAASSHGKRLKVKSADKTKRMGAELSLLSEPMKMAFGAGAVVQ